MDIKWVKIEDLTEEHELFDVVVKTDNREVHCGYFMDGEFRQYSKEGWSGRITHFVRVSFLIS